MANELIENAQLKDISDKLKIQFPNWIDRVSDGISKEKDWKNWTNNNCTQQNARHISCGTIKSQMHRRLFMKVAARLLLDAAQENSEIKNLVEQTS